MVLGKLPVPGRPTIWITVGQGPTALAVGAGGGCLDIFTLIYPFSPLSPSLWETARYRLKYCLKGPLNPNQPIKKSILKIAGHEQRIAGVTWQFRGILVLSSLMCCPPLNFFKINEHYGGSYITYYSNFAKDRYHINPIQKKFENMHLIIDSSGPGCSKHR